MRNLSENHYNFAVVRFDAENSVEIVSESWLICDKKLCLWPDNTDNFLNSLLKHERPGQKWKTFDCVVLKVYDDFEKAKLGRRRAEEETDWETTESEQEGTRAKRRKVTYQQRSAQPVRKYQQQSSRPQDSALPSHKQQSQHKEISNSNTLNDNESSCDDESDNLPLKVPDEGLVNCLNPNNQSQAPLLTTSRPQQFNLIPCPQQPSTSATTFPVPLTTTEGPIEKITLLGTYTIPEATLQTTGGWTTLGIQQQENATLNNGTSQRLDTVETVTLGSLQTAINNNKAETDRFQSEVLKLLLKINKDNEELLSRTTERADLHISNLPALPVTSTIQLLELNEWLASEENQKRLVKYLSTVGGPNHSSVTHRILSRVLSNDLARRLSLTGRGKNTDAGLKGTELLRTIYSSVRKTKKCGDTTESDIDKSIQNWLKNSGDRLGGRDQRRRQSCNPSIPESQCADTNV